MPRAGTKCSNCTPDVRFVITNGTSSATIGQTLMVAVFDDDVGSNDLIGSFQMPLQQVAAAGVAQQWFPIFQAKYVNFLGRTVFIVQRQASRRSALVNQVYVARTASGAPFVTHATDFRVRTRNRNRSHRRRSITRRPTTKLLRQLLVCPCLNKSFTPNRCLFRCNRLTRLCRISSRFIFSSNSRVNQCP